MSLPYTNEDIVRADRRRMHNVRNDVCNYFNHLIDSTKKSSKLLWASVAACIHGFFPMTFKYTALSVCLSIVENDLKHNKLHEPTVSSHMHDV
jgi:hypothetical protein